MYVCMASFALPYFQTHLRYNSLSFLCGISLGKYSFYTVHGYLDASNFKLL